MTSLKMQLSDRPGDIVVLSLSGPADLEGLPELEKILNGLAERKPKQVVIDMAGLTFIASLSIGAMIYFRQKCAKWGGKMAVAGASDLIATALRRTRVDMVLPMQPSVEAAIANTK